MTTNNHPAHGPVSLDRLHQIREILSKAAAQSDGGNLGYAVADAVKVIDGAIAAFGAEPQRNPVLAYADSYRDMAERGVESIPVWSVITDLERNIAPLYTAQPAPVSVHDESAIFEAAIDICRKSDAIDEHAWNHGVLAFMSAFRACRAAMLQAGNHTEQHLDMVDHFVDASEKGKDGTLINEGNIPATQIKPVADLYGITSPTGSETTFTFDAGEASSFAKGGWSVQEYVELERYQEAITGK
ncbi:hypothetical protein [Citrobacter portucalensis]|uniref:hypothetical protein n=1 Tax=Citrobacter portucalensis TaxID=1639133 RepID=UPI0040418529